MSFLSHPGMWCALWDRARRSWVGTPQSSQEVNWDKVPRYSWMENCIFSRTEPISFLQDIYWITVSDIKNKTLILYVRPAHPVVHSQEWLISNLPCRLTRNITSHSMKNLAFHSLLRWKMIILPHTFYVTWENVLYEHGGERVKWR